MRTIATVVIGAGHAGLAMSRCLGERGIDHVVLERGEVANSWRTERWDSLRLLTPNWQSRLPGFCYAGDDPGFRTMPEVIAFIDDYAQAVAAPVQTHTRVTAVRRTDAGYLVRTDRATGTPGPWCSRPARATCHACRGSPRRCLRSARSRRSTTATPISSSAAACSWSAPRRPESSSPTRSTARADRSRWPWANIRAPRTYRGRDIQWWMDAAGVLDQRYDEVDDIERARKVPRSSSSARRSGALWISMPSATAASSWSAVSPASMTAGCSSRARLRTSARCPTSSSAACSTSSTASRPRAASTARSSRRTVSLRPDRAIADPHA